jgi:hypothetical protein
MRWFVSLCVKFKQTGPWRLVDRLLEIIILGGRTRRHTCVFQFFYARRGKGAYACTFV